MKIVLTVDWHNIVVCKLQVLYLLILHVFNILESNMCHNMHLSWYVYRLSVFRLQVVLYSSDAISSRCIQNYNCLADSTQPKFYL